MASWSETVLNLVNALNNFSWAGLHFFCYLAAIFKHIEKEKKEQPAQGSSDNSIKSQMPSASQSFPQAIPTATVTGPAPISSTIQPLPGNTFTGQQMPIVQEERFSPFAQQNLQQPIQGPQPLIQMQGQPPFQQPGPLMQQQPPTLIQQQAQSLMQHGPPMMQQTQQTVPPIMQQQLQQPMPLMDQPQIIQPGFNVSVQQPQPPQMQPPQMVIQQPQMMPQMSSNMGPMGPQQNVAMGIPNVGPQQNVPFGMPNMGPQQNIQMRPSGMAQPGSSQHGMVPNSQSVVRPQLGIPQSKNIPFGGPVQRPQGYDRPFMNQQHQSQFSNSQSFPRSQNRQLTTVNIQKTNVNQTKAVKSTNHESSQKSSQSNFTSRKEPDLSSYKIPKKDSPRKGVQDTKSDDKQRGRTDSRDARKPEESTKRGTSDNRPSSSQAKDTKNTKDDSRSSSSAGRHQDSRKTGDSRSGRSGSRDSRGSGSRRDRDRSPGSRKSDSIKYIDHRKSEKEKSTGFIYRDHRPSERSSDSRYTDRRKQPSKEGDRSKTSDKPGGNKEISETVITPSGSKPPDSKNEESSKESKLHVDRKQANERNDKSDERKSGSHVGTGDRETRVDKSKEKSEQGAGIKTDNKQKNQDDGKSKIDSNKLSDKTKPLESKTKEENKSKISDNKERDDISRATDNRSKSSGSKSGSFIEIESSDSIKKSTGKEESAASSCVITVDIVPKRKHERTDSQDDSKSKHAKIAASPANASSSSASRNKDIGKKESVHELVKDIKPDRIDKQDKIVPTKVDIKEEVFKSPVNNPKGKLACAVTVDLVDISTLSQVQLKELKQGSPQKETPTGGVVLEASSVKLDLKPKIKEEILSPKSKPKIKEEIISPKSKIKEEVVSPQGKSKEARTGPEAETGKQKETTVAAVMVKKEVTSPVSERKAEKRVELTKRESVVSERKDIWSVTDEWAENDAMDVHHESQKNSNKVLRKAESQSADKVNVVVEVEIGDKNEKAKRLSSRNEEKAKAMIPGCSVTVEMGDDVKEPEAMEFDVSSKDDQTGDGDNEQSDDDDFIDFSEFVTLDEEGEVDDMNIGSVHAQVEETSKLSLDKKESRSEKSRSSRSRSRERSRKSGQSDHKSPRRTRSRDRHRSRSDRSKSKDKWSTRSGKSGDGDSKRSGSSHGQEITEDSRRHLRSQPPDDIHLEDSVKQQKPSRAYQYCPAKGCNTSTKLLKAHVYTAHIPSLFHQLEEEDRRKNDIHRQRLNGLRQLAVGILGEHSSIHDLVEYLNQNLSIVIVHPATTIWSPLQTDMQALCQFAGWPVPDNFRVYPDINSPASLLYWRILLFLMDELPEQERREFYTSYNIPSIEQDNEEGTSRVSDADSRSPRRDKTLSTSKSERVSEGKSGTSSSRTKAPTRMTVEVEVSDKPTKSEKPDGDKTEEGLVAMSRALLKEKSRSSSGHGTKSNKCSVEVGVVEDSKKSEKADDCKTKDSDKQTDARETRSRRQTRSQKPKCEVSVSIN